MGLVLSSHDDILVDTLQGVLTLKSEKECNIEVQSVETTKLVIDAPHANVTLNLKSLHDLSHIRCKTASIFLSQRQVEEPNFFIFDQLKASLFKMNRDLN